MYQLSDSGIPYLDWGGHGPALHLAHANGFPPGTYNALAQLLTPTCRVLGMECRALWPNTDPAALRHWREFGEDLATFLNEMQLQGVVAAGHSLGAVTSLFCAAQHPKLVRALILIDPVIPPVWFAPVWALVMALGLNRRTPLATRARQRRMDAPSLRVLLRAYQSVRVFHRWQEPFLADYVDSVAVEQPDGSVRLRYPREWEARIFETMPADTWCVMPRLRHLPLLVLRGELSETYHRDAMRVMRWMLPQGQFVEIPGADHFVPMSQPKQTVEAILAFLEST
jgi:pimeloyl-ACP methyl ester carboxylesterase